MGKKIEKVLKGKPSSLQNLNASGASNQNGKYYIYI